MAFLYEKMKQEWRDGRLARKFRGDQEFVGHVLQTLNYPMEYIHLPGVVSYKNCCRGKTFDLEKMRFIIFHGVPKPHQLLDDDPIKAYWK